MNTLTHGHVQNQYTERHRDPNNLARDVASASNAIRNAKS